MKLRDNFWSQKEIIVERNRQIILQRNRCYGKEEFAVLQPARALLGQESY
jgi:hypothetical protein